MAELSGSVIKGYELSEHIGTGGFGAVYRAYQSTVGREVAIKVILPDFANQPEFVRRFETEAQLIARLEPMNITPLYDYWRDPKGAYLVMRYLRGGNLNDALKQGAYDLEAAALLIDQVASALAVAHRNQVIHRDIKPANILLDEDGNAYISDFGLAPESDQTPLSKIFFELRSGDQHHRVYGPGKSRPSPAQGARYQTNPSDPEWLYEPG
jgi:serine/threonine-protein kinase